MKRLRALQAISGDHKRVYQHEWYRLQISRFDLYLLYCFPYLPSNWKIIWNIKNFFCQSLRWKFWATAEYPATLVHHIYLCRDRSRHNTIDSILIYWHVNEWQGILLLSRKFIRVIEMHNFTQQYPWYFFSGIFQHFSHYPEQSLHSIFKIYFLHHFCVTVFL